MALTQDIARNVELYDLSIRGVVEGLANGSLMAETPEMRQLVLFDRAATAPYLGSILVEDARGDVLLDSSSLVPRSFNYADRAYFKAQSTTPELGLFISEPLQSKTDQEWVVNLSRRYNKPDGSFGGVVAGTLRLEYLHRLYARMRLGPNGSMTLFRTDGTVIMREPYDAALLGRAIKPALLFERLAEAPEGEYEARSAVDGVDRLYHYQRVGDLPLVQNVAMSIADIYSDWWRKAVEVSAVLATACLVIVALALTLRIELRRRHEAEAALFTLAGEDALTGLANRRRFDEVLAEEMRRSVRHGWRLSLLLVDVDHFKSYNDAFGHVAGDAALVSLASCLARRTQRSGDLAARYGGEEFAVVLPHVGAADALSIAEGIRRDVLGLGLRSPASAHGALSVSIGIASVTLAPDDAPADLVETADAALSQSKAEGRDRSTLFVAVGQRASEPPAAAFARSRRGRGGARVAGSD